MAAKLSFRKRRHAEEPKVTLVSLVDFFTCLIFFLLALQDMGAGAVVSKDIELPLSISKAEIKADTVVAITPTSILVEGFNVGDVVEESQRQELLIPGLQAILEKIKTRASAWQQAGAIKDWEGRMIIQSDKNAKFEIIKRVMFTAGQSGFSVMSLAVTRKGVE